MCFAVSLLPCIMVKSCSGFSLCRAMCCKTALISFSPSSSALTFQSKSQKCFCFDCFHICGFFLMYGRIQLNNIDSADVMCQRWDCVALESWSVLLLWFVSGGVRHVVCLHWSHMVQLIREIRTDALSCLTWTRILYLFFDRGPFVLSCAIEFHLSTILYDVDVNVFWSDDFAFCVFFSFFNIVTVGV